MNDERAFPDALDDYFSLINAFPEIVENTGAFFTVVLDRDKITDWQAKRRSELHASGLPTDWARIGIVLDDPYISILRDLVEFPGGDHRGYFRLINKADLSGGQGVVVLPLIDHRVLLLRQFRHATRDWHWEIPRGFGEPNISAMDNARLEIEEEVNGVVDHLIDLGPFHNNTGAERNVVQLFFARLESIGEPNRNEGIDRIQLIPVQEFEEMISNSAITDAFTIGAYARAKLKGLFN